MEPLDNNNNSIKRIGFIIAAKKTNSFGIRTTLSYLCNKWNIELIDIDPNVNLESQGPFDVILHKISDYSREYETGDKHAKFVFENLLNYSKKHQSVNFLDPINDVLKLADREKMNIICKNCEFTCDDIQVFSPNWVVAKSIDSAIDIIKDIDFLFPCVCKGLDASEGSGAHDMQFVFNKQQISELTIVPCIIQEFINHDAILYKLFIIGSRWWVVTRPSIRNFKTSDYDQPCVHFNSHDVSKSCSSSFLNNFALNYKQKVMSYDENPSSDTYNLLNRKVIDTLIQRLWKNLKCHLLGVDIIIDSKTGNYGLVDINFLPGYDGVPNLTQELAEFLRSLIYN